MATTRGGLRLAVLGLAGAGCASTTTIDSSTTATGAIEGDRITIADGAVLSADGRLELRAKGDIVIEGRIVGKPGSTIELHSTEGNVRVTGSITAGAGVAGTGASAHPFAGGGPGGAGGDVVIRAAGHVEIRGSIRAGAGGPGGNATAHGPGPRSDARGGVGGPGGHVRITAGEGLEVHASIQAGEGGLSGSANATVTDPGGAPGEEEIPGETTHLPSLASAHVPGGGPGGEVRIEFLGNDLSRVDFTGAVAAGKGGGCGESAAVGPDAAIAEVAAAAAGGDVVITGTGFQASAAGFQTGFAPGRGGSSADLAGTPGGRARAHARANEPTARVWDGGLGGRLVVNGIEGLRADAGGSGTSEVAGGTAAIDHGKPARGPLPGGTTHAP